MRSRMCTILALTLVCGACGTTKSPVINSTGPATSSSGATSKTTGSSMQYPAAPRSDDFDLFHGVRVADPYRWLEQDTSPQVREWTEQQNELYDSSDSLGDLVGLLLLRLVDIDV